MERRTEALSAAPTDFHIGRWLVQPTLNLIRDGGTVRHLEPQTMDLLASLAKTGGRVVSKDEIIDAVWEGRFIAEATLTRSIADFEVGGRRYSVFAHEWRVEPAQEWLRLKVERASRIDAAASTKTTVRNQTRHHGGRRGEQKDSSGSSVSSVVESSILRVGDELWD